MKIEEKSHYIKQYTNDVSIYYYDEVFEGGFSVDVYNIADCEIDFEDAVWSGGFSHDCNYDKKTTAKLYNSWTKSIYDTKQRLIEMGEMAAIAPVEELKAGDCIFCIVPPYDELDVYDYTSYHFFKIKSVTDDKINAEEIQISKYYFCKCKQLTEIKNDDNEWIDHKTLKKYSVHIDEKVYSRAAEILKSLTTKLIAEIKKELSE